MKYPLVRSRLLKLWREARDSMRTPVAAWASIVEDPEKRAAYTSKRGLGGFVRATWDEVNEIIAAANAYTVKTYGPDRVFGFSPIPAMSMVSYAAGSRYLSLLGGVCMSFYDWYCDLPPASPQTWGEQTDVPESADWYNAGFLILWGSNVPQTRTPDAHFYTEARYRGAKSVVICPDYSEASKFADLWISVKQGTDAALAMAMGHVILREFHIDRQAQYFDDYARQYTDMPMLVRLVKQGGTARARAARCAPRTSPATLGETNNPEWKTVAYDETERQHRRAATARSASAGARRASGTWRRRKLDGEATKLRLSLADVKDDVAESPSPISAIASTTISPAPTIRACCVRNVPAKRLQLNGRRDAGRLGASICSSPITASIAASAASNVAQELRRRTCPTRRPGPRRSPACRATRSSRWRANSRCNAEKTKGRSMVIIGAGMNHWYHMRHELPRHHQHAGDVRLRRPVGRRLVALCRPGKAAPADRLAAARLRARLGPPAAAAELDLVLLRPHRPVALRDARRRRNPVADRARRARGTAR